MNNSALAESTITRVVVRNLIDLERGPIEFLPWGRGSSISDFEPTEVKELPDKSACYCILNGRKIPFSDWAGTMVVPHDHLVFVRVPGFWMFVLYLALMLGSAYAYKSLMPKNKSGESPTYSFDQIETTARTGQPIPVVYGKHAVGGQYINTFKTLSKSMPINSSGQTIEFGYGEPRLSALIALSEGPISAIGNQGADVDNLTGDDIPLGIRINGVEARDIPGINVSWRLGYPDQTPIGGFSDTSVSVNVNKTVYAASPVTEITTTEVDAFSVILTWPSGLIYIGSSKIHTVNQQLRFRYQRLATASSTPTESAWTTFNITVKGKTTSSFSLEFKFDNLENGFYAVQVVRLQTYDDPTFGGYSTQYSFDTLNQITYGDSLSYPNVALLGLKNIPASIVGGGGLPVINVEVLGKLVYIWTGGTVSSPVFSLLYSDSPAWCAADMLLNQRYGGGAFGMNLCDLDLQGFDDWADYAAELIDIGDGASTLGARFTCNAVFDTKESIWDQVQKIASSSRVALIKTGRKVKPKIDRAASVVQLFTMGNIVRDSFAYITDTRQDKPNYVEVQYLNEDDSWNPDTQVAFGSNLSEFFRKDPIRFSCITRSYQAARQAKYILNIHELSRRAVEFEVPIDALASEPGDVVAVAHDSTGWAIASGRVVAATSTTVTLDSEVTVPGVGSLSITVRTSGTGADVFQTRVCNSSAGVKAAGTSLSISSAWNGGDVPVKGDIWSASTTTIGGLAAKPYRIQSVERDYDKLTARIEATEYTTSIYSDDPGDVPSVSGGENPGQLVVPPEVIDLVAVEVDTVQDDGTLIIQASLSWSKPTSSTQYKNKVYYKITSDPAAQGGFDYIGETDGASFIVGQQFIALGESYIFAVTSATLEGLEFILPGDAPQVALSITGSNALPPDITGFQVSQNGSQLVFIWNALTISNLQGYEIRSGASWQGGSVVATDIPGATYSTTNYTPNVLNTFWIKAKNNLGNYSLNPVSVSITPSFPPGSVDIDNEQATTWPGTKVSYTVQPNGTLKMNGAPSLTWATATFSWDSATASTTTWDGGSSSYETAALDAGTVAERLVQIGLTVQEFDSTLTWATATFAWDSATGVGSTWLGIIADGNNVIHTVKVSISDDDITYTPFAVYVPGGQYSFRYIKIRVESVSSDPDILGILSSLHTVATTV